MIPDVGLRLEKRGARPRCGFRSAGFTLLETLVVVAIIGLMAVIAVPWFQRIRQRYLVKSAAFEIQSSLLAARMRAIKNNLGATVVITVATGPQVAHEIDVTEGALPPPPPPTPTPVPYSRSFLISRKSVDIVTTPPAGTISFGGDGRLVSAPAPTPATIVVSGPPGAVAPNAVTIETSASGRVRVITPVNWN